MTGLSTELRLALQSLFGSQADIDSGAVKWNVDQAAAYESDHANLRQSARSLFTRGQGGTRSLGLPADVPQESLAALRETLAESEVELSAVGVGRKPIFHEDLGLIAADLAVRIGHSLEGATQCSMAQLKLLSDSVSRKEAVDDLRMLVVLASVLTPTLWGGDSGRQLEKLTGQLLRRAQT